MKKNSTIDCVKYIIPYMYHNFHVLNVKVMLNFFELNKILDK